MNIMVRTRGLGRASSRIIGRTLGREVSRDANEGPQQKRPTTSTRRQREGACVAEDVKHVDHVVEELHKQPGEAPVDDVVSDAEGVPGGPHDTSVLMDYVHYVAVTIWNEEEPELKLSSHGNKVEKFGRPAPEIEVLMAAT
ncbi:hypothetical protein GmHk_17G049011 [Glycine max]|nr:hypothetical protein GmHk_17G049011 [Glycine max]